MNVVLRNVGRCCDLEGTWPEDKADYQKLQRKQNGKYQST